MHTVYFHDADNGISIDGLFPLINAKTIPRIGEKISVSYEDDSSREEPQTYIVADVCHDFLQYGDNPGKHEQRVTLFIRPVPAP